MEAKNLGRRPPHTRDTRASHTLSLPHFGRHVLDEFKHCATTKACSQLHAHLHAAPCTSARRPDRPVKAWAHARLANAPPKHCASPPGSLPRAYLTSHVRHAGILPASYSASLNAVLLASSFSREHSEAYTLLDLQRPASDWASCCQLPSFCDTSLRSGRVLS